MNGGPNTMPDTTLRRYLLGQLSSQEQSRVEERLFTDAVYLEQVEVAEDDLIEAYVRGDLSPTERRLFERNFLTTPQRRAQLELTRSLRRTFGRTGDERPAPWWRTVWPFPLRPAATWLVPMAASLVIAVGLIGYVAVKMTQQRVEVAQRQREWEQQRAARDSRIHQLEDQLRREREQRQQGEEQSASIAEAKPPRLNPFSLVLVPDVVVRGEQSAPPNRTVPSDRAIQLHLDLQLDTGQPYDRYHVIVKNSEGDQVSSADSVKSTRRDGQPVVTVTVPAGRLKPGEYRIELFGQNPPGGKEEVDNYSFRVVPR